MTMIRYNIPWAVRPSARVDLRQVVDRFFGESEAATAPTAAAATPSAQWTPRVDIREDEAEFVLLVDVPGVDPASVEVQMDKSVLTIKGERAADTAEEGQRYSRRERALGAFQRSFGLPDSADADGITATGKHGVLEIRIPKKAAPQPRRIQVQ